jgi:hypothetical protein
MVEGHALLRRYIDEERRITRVETAGELKVSVASVHYWVSGGQRPRAFERDLIEKWSGGAVPAESWATDEERERLAALSAPGRAS